VKEQSFLDYALTRQLFSGAPVDSRATASQLYIILDRFISDSRARGHTNDWLRHHVRVIEHFGHWLKHRRIPWRCLSTLHVQKFLFFHLPRCRCKDRGRWKKHVETSLRKCRPALRRFVEFMRRQHQIKETAEKIPNGPIDRLIAQYDRHMEQVCGFSVQTRCSRRSCARKFLEWRLGRRGLTLKMRVQNVPRFLLSKARRLSPKAMRALVSDLRSFLRFLEFSGHVRPGLVGFVPQPVPAPPPPLPKALERKQLRKFLASFRRNDPRGRRDYAMFLCWAHLALRPQEVVGLTLDDVDWRAMTVRLTQTKQRRERLLPLPDVVAKALLSYLKNGRPATQSRMLFVRDLAPFDQALTAGYVRRLARRAFARCQIDARPYVLRHTWATHAHRRGAGLKLIADVLGHRSLDSTIRYAQVNLEELRQVALPWPKINQ